MAKGSGLGFVTGLVVGGVLGIAATIALGPELDEETRRKLREEGLRWRGRANDLTARALAETDDLIDQTRLVLDQQRARLREAVEESKRAAAEKQRELRAKFEKAEQEGEAEL